MKLSRRSIYALRVLRHLADAYPRRELLSAAYLADREGLSAKFVEQILTQMRKAGFLVSTRGKEGGYILRVPPEQITIGGVIRLIDGALAPIPCASRTQPHRDDDCPFPYETCWLRLLMLRVRDSISAVLDQETLAQIAADARSMEREMQKEVRPREGAEDRDPV
jgi:Rrf2 family protein